ncbi:MAG: glycine--tRNA ligase subunit beta, partial [Acidobacteriota bacterium]
MAESSPTSVAPGGNGEFLLELRAEEIPARMLPGATRELATRVFEELMGRGLGPREVETGFTPRRILLVLRGVPARQADQEETLWGPPVGAAYDKQGNPTSALLGFAKRAEVEPGEVQRAKKDKGEYLMAVRTKVGRPAPEVLAEVVPRVAAALAWPKTMRWGDGIGPWVRPLHGILALYEGEVVPIELFGVRAGATTVGHPVLSPEPFVVHDAADYRSKLAERGIVVSPEERKRRLAERMAARAAELGGKL